LTNITFVPKWSSNTPLNSATSESWECDDHCESSFSDLLIVLTIEIDIASS